MKTIFFDFDGTLSYKSPNAWRIIDEYVLRKNKEIKEDYTKNLQRFLSGEIDYTEWCVLVSNNLKTCNFSHETLQKIGEEIHLIPDAEKVFDFLTKRGYKIQIISGGIREIIEKTLGNNLKYIEKINSNEIIFDKNGLFKDISATEFDYKGKAKCIKNYMDQTYTKKEEIIFVGNSSNDEWVWTTGVKTICINPDGADIGNKEKWNVVLKEVNSLQDILPEVLTNKSKTNFLGK